MLGAVSAARCLALGWLARQKHSRAQAEAGAAGAGLAGIRLAPSSCLSDKT
uniref:Uncharacterized protein n=1 Tax=Ralstonia solanacearum TaxID=305 RepID=A0A0S4TPG5_RALSL|nr:protein of unknown function [Ralstonia solanacearum]